MKRLALFLFVILGACEASVVEPPVNVVVPEIELNTVDPNIERKGALLLLGETAFSGYLTDYYENGKLKSKTGYFEGLKEGLAFQYYENGTLKEKRFYRTNRKHDHHQGWWPNGHQKFDYHFTNGLQQGLSKEWYQDGQPYREFNYADGQENGSQKMWEASGKIRANYVVKDGHRYGLIGLKNCKSVSDEKGVFTARAY